MRVALISYEFPPDTALGGIATYVSQISRSLVAHGVEVEVFCGSATRTDSSINEGVRVHRVRADRADFPMTIVSTFKRRHDRRPFDIIEGPDYLAEAGEVARAAPEVPYVVKLHTPYYLVYALNRAPLTLTRIRDHLRLLWYVVKTRDARVLLSPEHQIFQAEKKNLHIADEIVAPSHAIAHTLGRKWRLDDLRLSRVPLAYEPTPDLLEIPVETETHRITYIGRLECRKGVQDLAKAIPLILRKHPQVRFRFVGAVGPSAKPGVDMHAYILNTVPTHWHRQLEFTGNVPYEEIPRHLSETDICVFPSHWESFGFVVLEAMAAGRAVICTDNGGMAELLNHGEFGLLVPPKKPIAIVNSLSRLLADPTLRHHLGRKARHEGLSRYSHAAVAPRQLSSYERAIARRKWRLRSPIPPLRDFRTWLVDQIHPAKSDSLRWRRAER
jgi:glycogen synthase